MSAARTPLPTRADVDAATVALTGVFTPTPLQRNDRLSAASGWDVWLKREDLQPVRSYKGRGAYTMVAQLDDAARAAGVTCASAGNHAQGLALACARAGVRARIFLPRTTPRQKRERVAVLGSEWVEVVIGGDTYDDAAAAAAAHAAESGATIVPAFDEPRIVAGQGTVTDEILTQMTAEIGRAPDVLVVPVGGGGLLAGAVCALEDEPVRLVGAEPAGAASMAAAIAAGAPVDLEELDGFVDGAAVRRVGTVTHAVVAARPVAPTMIAVDEGRICVEMLDLYQSDGIVAEPAGALAAAALDQLAALPDAPAAGSTVVCVVSGGNNDVSRYAEVVERALVHEGRKHYFLVEFPQEPGALRRFLDEVLGPEDDITLFEYVKRSNRETGPALVGIELGDPADLYGLNERLAASPLRVEAVAPDSPLFRYLL
ncbi:threonine ammonia-lyase IlvA [Nocardioides massiliensis]|uniref:L-threonine dehydratase n=1 Tax=Nocardioides massiliensis TaxID=1325935 RepID=A0ABT9NQY5_9ACTN|nr:threonine ammonia-lyase IlvA [Nocardioides massiliensis]MDP9822846.1 threonine dehydratase [Nocardioides massiliensis]